MPICGYNRGEGNKMKPQLLSVYDAIAYGAKLSVADFVYHYAAPALAGSENAMKKLGLNAVCMDSFSAAAHAAEGCELGGKRSLVLSSVSASPGFYSASYMRLPVVSANVWPGSNKTIGSQSCLPSFRDAGFLVFMPESPQETVDTIAQAYKVSESRNVLLPSVVNIDMTGFQEPANMPEERFVRNYVSKFSLPHQITDRKHHYFNATNSPEFAQQQRKAMKNAAAAIENASDLWKKKTARKLPAVEQYKLEDADYAVIISGFHSTTAKAAVNRMRAEGKKVGLLRVRVFSPWPSDAVKQALKNVKKSFAFDQSISIASCGILHAAAGRDAGFCSGFILINRYPSEKDFVGMFERLMKSEKEEIVWFR